MQLPHSRFSFLVDRFITRLGNALSWIWLVLLTVIVMNVTLRYLFEMGSIELEELQWHLYAVGFLTGLSYAVVSDSHIRVDVVREKLSETTKVWVEFYGLLLLLIPFVLLVLFASIPFIEYSFRLREISEAPGGLPFRWIIKGTLFVGFTLLLVVSVARLTRVWLYLFGWPAVEVSHDEGNAAYKTTTATATTTTTSTTTTTTTTQGAKP
jgi:TRAP-type mannitol/chloroaromatic compound transport system permease small subunit